MQPDSETIELRIIVYRDGVSVITQNVSVGEIVPQITLDLLSKEVENVLVGDAFGTPLGYRIQNESIIIDTLGASSVYFTYQTALLTDKDGPVWTFSISPTTPTTIILPDSSTIIFLNEIPDSITTLENKTTLSLGEGEWLIKYTLPLQVIELRNENGIPANVQGPLSYINSNLAVLALSIAILGSGLLIYLRRSGKVRYRSGNLRPEEEEVLRFIEEQGGKVLEAELRKKFILPKTSMWRMAKRLERAGLVKINRLGLQNEIELVKSKP